MTEDKLDKLKELEETAGRGSEGQTGKASPGKSSDSDKTQEMPLNILQEKLEQERLQRLKEESQETTEPESMEEKEAEPRPEDEGPLHVTEADMPTPGERMIEEDLIMPRRPAVSPLTRGIVLAIVLLLTIMLYFMFKSMNKKTAAPPQPVTTEKKQEEVAPPKETPIMATIPVKPEKEAPPPPVFELSGDIFQGSAPILGEEKEPVLSKEADPEIAATAKALATRMEILYGSKTTTRRGIETKVISGRIQRFRIVNTIQEKEGQIIRNDISIVTPSRGTINIKNNVLDSVRNTDYEKFLKELGIVGIEVNKIPTEDENTVKVQLRMTKFNGTPTNNEYLIGEAGVGGVVLGMPIEDFKSALPTRRYVVVEKKVEHEGKYYNTYKVYDKQNKSLFFINEKDGKVWGIQIVNNKFKTEKGIGIGSTLGELRINYLGNSPVKITTTPGGLPYVAIDEIKGMFVLQAKGLNLDAQVFPHNSKITDILLGGSPFIK